MLGFFAVVSIAVFGFGVIGIMAAMSYSAFYDDQETEGNILKAGIGATFAGMAGLMVCGIFAAAKVLL